MKSLKIPILIILACATLTSCAKKSTSTPIEVQTQANDQSEILQLYKDAITTLQDELKSLKEESYILTTEYEMKIRDLEERIESLTTSKDTSPDINHNTPHQNLTTESPATNYKYTITNNGAVITKYIGTSDNVQIPTSIEGRPVIKIYEYAFSGTNVKSVTIPEGVQEIDWFAFYNCSSLQKVYIPSSITSIGYGAFDYCASALTIFCYADSYAQKYAQSFGIKYSNQ